MPVQLTIRENGCVLYYVFTDPWTVEQVLELRDQNLGHRDACPFTIHAVFNLSGTRVFPPKALSLRHGSPELEHPRSGQVVIVGANELVRSLMELIITLSRTKRIKFVSTDADAWTYLRSLISD